VLETSRDLGTVFSNKGTEQQDQAQNQDGILEDGENELNQKEGPKFETDIPNLGINVRQGWSGRFFRHRLPF